MLGMKVKELKYIKARAEGKNKQDSAMEATGSKNSKVASVQAYRMEKKPDVKKELARVLNKYKITINRAVKPINDGLEAEKTIAVGKGKDAYTVTVPDYTTRLKASDRSLELLGVKDSTKKLGNPENYIGEPGKSIAPELIEALKNGDIKELQRIIFNDGSGVAGVIEVNKDDV